MNKLIVISGCSGGGKSTLLAELKISGYSVIQEVGREIVQEQLASNGNLTPWNNPKGFCELAIEKSKKYYQLAQRLKDVKNHIVFFDRSILDAISFYQTLNIADCRKYDSLISEYQYFETVFFAPPWKEIFIEDDERKHSYEDAVSEYNRLVCFYTQYGYQIITLPKSGVKDRVQFVLDKLVSQP